MKERIVNEINSNLGELLDVARYLFDNPELGGVEYKANKLLTETLKKHGFTVENEIYSIKTAFRAEYDSHKDGAVVAFFCEFDALPGIGHGCGHNLISAMSLGAAVGLKSVIDEIGGKIVVFGTPAEETSGAKVQLAEYGAFAGITIAMMVHPSTVTEASGSSLALNAFKFQFTGKTAHAAQAPEQGINALDAVIQMFNGINALRQHLTSDVRIHGIISNGGKAPNVVPDFAEAQFYIRASKREYLSIVTQKVIECAKGAELMTGATVNISKFENSYDNLKTNSVLSNIFNNNLLALGEQKINPAGMGIGSIDMGNVSQVVPSIHPWLGFGDERLLLHTKEFADCTITERGKNLLVKGAYALATTAYDVMISKEIQENIQKEFIKS